MSDMYRPNDPYVLCARTGFKVRRSETVVESRSNLRVLASHADPEHPRDHRKQRPHGQRFRIAASEPVDRFVALNEITKDSF